MFDSSLRCLERAALGDLEAAERYRRELWRFEQCSRVRERALYEADLDAMGFLASITAGLEDVRLERIRLAAFLGYAPARELLGVEPVQAIHDWPRCVMWWGGEEACDRATLGVLARWTLREAPNLKTRLERFLEEPSLMQSARLQGAVALARAKGLGSISLEPRFAPDLLQLVFRLLGDRGVARDELIEVASEALLDWILGGD